MSYNLKKLRDLIIEAFDDAELDAFCSDHFHEVYERFSSEMRKDKKAFLLVNYCYRREQLQTLEEKVREANPAKFEEYEDQLMLRHASVDSPARPDIFSRYETGLRQLIGQVKPGQPQQHAEVLVYQQRLVENITQSRRYGDNDILKFERARIIDRLNEFTLATLGKSFNELCDTL
jgi:hypothetical protein